MNEIQEILDSLDRQLAAGKIDLETYQRLTAKWQARLTTSPDAVSGGAQPAAAAEKISCPECGAPLDDLGVQAGDTVRCGFCRATFTLKRARDQSEQFGQELRRWLDQLVVESVGTGTVDAASRRFIFSEKLFPALQREYRRSLEPYEDAHEQPLTYLDLLAPLPGFRPGDHALARYPDALPRVRALNAKLNSGLLAEFAVVEDDRQKLRSLDLGTANLVHLSNVAQLLAQPTADAYASARENLAALQRLFADTRAMLPSPGADDYRAIIRARLDAGIRVLEVLERVFSPEADFAAQVFLEELESTETLLAEARQRAETTTFNPLALVPVRMGLEREARIVTLLQALLHAYRTFSRSRPLAFTTFYADLKTLLSLAVPEPADIDHLIALVNYARAVVQARRGMEVLHLVDNWTWVDRQIEAGRKQSLFGGSETVAWQNLYWHPYWCAVVRYSVAKGTFLVSGVEQTGYGLVDAAARQAVPTSITAESSLHSAIAQGVTLFGAAGSRPALLPSMPAKDAQKVVTAALQQATSMRNARVTDVQLLYLPAVLVQYQAKSGSRASLYTLAGMLNVGIGRQLDQIGSLLERYV